MRFAVVTLGSAGDLHPFLAIARGLVQRGHEVYLLSQAPYEQQSLAEGVPFISVVDAATHERTLTHPALWHPLNGFGVLWRHLAVPAIEPVCETLGRLARQSDDPLVVLASPLAAGARFARDRWPDRIRLLSGYTAPMGLRHVEDPMFLGGWKVPTWTPHVARNALWRLLDRWKLEPMARPVLERWQGHWATTPIRSSIFGNWLHSPDGGLAMYSAAFAAVPSTWSARRVHQTGFPLFEPDSPMPLPASFSDFLRRHPRYVLLYPGSAAGTAQQFSDLVLPACRELGLPCVVLAAHLHRNVGRLSSAAESVLHIDQAALAPLLMHANVFVHHGGIGSVAQGLQGQVPQLVLASAYDQFENGSRIAALGAGSWLRLARASTKDVTQLLDHLRMGVRPDHQGDQSSEMRRPRSSTDLACVQLEREHSRQC